MKRVEIKKGRGRVYFDPETRWIRMDYDGTGPGMELTGEEMLQLSKALWRAARITISPASPRP